MKQTHKKFKIINICWDNEQGDTSHLPFSKTINISIKLLEHKTVEDIISNALSDLEGWTAIKFEIKEINA